MYYVLSIIICWWHYIVILKCLPLLVMTELILKVALREYLAAAIAAAAAGTDTSNNSTFMVILKLRVHKMFRYLTSPAHRFNGFNNKFSILLSLL